MMTKPEAKVAGVSAVIASGAMMVLLHFGLIGPDAEQKAVVLEGRMVALEVKHEALKTEVKTSMVSLERLIEVRMTAIELALRDIRSDLKKANGP